MVSTLLFGLSPFLLTAGDADSSGGIFGLLLPFVLIFAVFYFFIYRPQQKREQKHSAMVENLKKGDQIVTIGGIHGTVRRIDDDSILAQVDSNGVKLRIDKQAISSVGGEDVE